MIVDGLGKVVAFVVAVPWFGLYRQTHERVVIFKLDHLSGSRRNKADYMGDFVASIHERERTNESIFG